MAGENKDIVYEKYTEDDFKREVIGVDYEEIKDLLVYKKNILLQGAPGVGKTYSAKRIAYAMMGCKDDSRITSLQFHSNYTYEDFIEGLRPNTNGSFSMVQGPFILTCKAASRNPNKEYFMIIDEINRANISAVLGEAFQLIEKEHRDEWLTLKYGSSIKVPKNLYIIGTMNTADRGLAVLDYALRRRFSFYTMEPAFNHPDFKRVMGKNCSKQLTKTIKIIRELNEAICKDELLGPGFQIGHSYFLGHGIISSDVLKNIIHYEIDPLLDEYWYDDSEGKADAWKTRLEGVLDEQKPVYAEY